MHSMHEKLRLEIKIKSPRPISLPLHIHTEQLNNSHINDGIFPFKSFRSLHVMFKGPMKCNFM